MMDECSLSISFLNVLLVGIAVDAEDFIVVLPLALLQLDLGLLQELPVFVVRPVRSVHVLGIPESVVELFKLHMILGPPVVGLQVVGVQLDRHVAIFHRLAPLFQLK